MLPSKALYKILLYYWYHYNNDIYIVAGIKCEDAEAVVASGEDCLNR